MGVLSFKFVIIARFDCDRTAYRSSVDQGNWVGEEDRAGGLIEDGSIMARMEGCSVGHDTSAPTSNRSMHDAGD